MQIKVIRVIEAQVALPRLHFPTESDESPGLGFDVLA
jgi:hypothetical protein